MHDVQVSVTAPYKFQVALDFDWVSETAEVSSDLTEWDESVGKPKDRKTLQTAALAFMAEVVGLKSSKASFIEISSNGIAKDPGLKRKIEKQDCADFLIVLRGGSYHIPDSEEENEEDIKAHLGLLDLSRVKTAAECYYSDKGTFKGFLAANRKFDRKHTRVQGGVFPSESPIDCSGFFLKIFTSGKSVTEKEKGSKLAGKMIEAVSFEYQNDTGEWIIRTPEYSGRVRDAFISELHILSKKPSKPSHPNIGTPS
jgi:hypothetical protein